MFEVLGFQITTPVLTLGAISGMSYGVLSVGLVLIYRSNRIINFAHGEIGAFGAALLSLAVARWRVPYWVAFPLALAAAGAAGALAEIAVIRRLRKAPALMSIVATLGVSQFLLFLSFAINSELHAGHIFPQPPGFPSFAVGALRVTPAYLGILVLTPLMVAGLALFLRRSRFGIAIIGSAANPEAARMAGVSASRMSTLAWAMAGAISAFTAILVFPTRQYITAESLGPGLLLRALVGAVVARMSSLPIALLTGIGVGIVEQALLWNIPRGGHVEMILFVVILIALLLQKRTGERHEEKGSWAAVQSWKPLPAPLMQIWTIRNLGWLVASLSLIVAVVLPFVITHNAATILVGILAFSLVGLSVGVVSGLAGQLSLGQFALAGIGATVSVYISSRTGNFLLGFFTAGLSAAVVSVAVGIPALRIRGLMLAVSTLSFGLASQSWLFRQSWMLGEAPDPGRPIIGSWIADSGKRYYLIAVLVTAVGMLLARNIRRGGLARRMIAVRDNEDGARAFTVPATLVKLQGFALAGFLAGVGGALYGHALSRLSAQSFPTEASFNVVAIAVLGGISILPGPLIGALYVIGFPSFVPLDSAGLAATSFGWLILILYFPGGIAQLLRPLRGFVITRLAGGMVEELEPPSLAPDLPRPTISKVLNIEPGKPASTVDPILVTEGLHKTFGGINAVQDVTFSIRGGETLGLMGPNGAGKTTLLELLSGFSKPDSGSIVFSGAPVDSKGPEERGKMGLIRSFQDAMLFPTMTVTEVLKLALERSNPTRFVSSMMGLRQEEKRKTERAIDLGALLGLADYLDRQISELSTGTRRITELACIVALDPDLLLLDEPSSGIAQRETEALAKLLGHLKEQLRMTMIIVEHDMPLIMKLSDRIIAMESGRIIAEGTPREITNNQRVIESYLGDDQHATKQ